MIEEEIKNAFSLKSQEPSSYFAFIVCVSLTQGSCTLSKGFDQNMEKNETKIDVKAESKIFCKCLIFQKRQLHSIQNSSLLVL